MSLFIDFVGMVWHRPIVVDRPRGVILRRPPLIVTRPLVVRPAPVVIRLAPVVVTPTPTVVIQRDSPTTVVVKKQPTEVTVVAGSKTEQKLRQLKTMYDQGLISRNEYKQKQEELLKQF